MANYNPQMHMLSDRRVFSLDGVHYRWSRCGHLTYHRRLTDDPSKVGCKDCVGCLTEAEKRERAEREVECET